jgi:hypothetical protein
MQSMAHVFRGIVALAWLGIFFQAAAAPAPAPKEPATGATMDAVIRAHGRPKGQITTGTREIWTYDRFRVMFENGRVLNVAPAERSRTENIVPSAPVSPAPSPAQGAAPPPAKSTAYPLTVTIGGSASDHAAKSPPRAAPTRPAAKPVDRATGGVMKIALIVMFAALGVAVAVVIWAHSKARSLEDQGTAQKLAERERRRDG